MNADTLIIGVPQNPAVIHIAADGKLFWDGREVATYEHFRAAMLEWCWENRAGYSLTMSQFLRSKFL